MYSERAAQDAVMAAIGKNMAVTGGGTSVLLWGLDAGALAAIGGLIVAVVGLCIQFYYKRRSDKREGEYHTARMRGLLDE